MYMMNTDVSGEVELPNLAVLYAPIHGMMSEMTMPEGWLILPIWSCPDAY